MNHVRKLYEPFTPEQISRKIVERVRPKGIEWKGEVEIIFQTIEHLHAAVPHHTGDWYFTGKYPTPGGYRVVNQAYVNYYEKSEGRGVTEHGGEEEQGRCTKAGEVVTPATCAASAEAISGAAAFSSFAAASVYCWMVRILRGAPAGGKRGS